ncbi:DUF4132 domain-containing protein [Fredinandcohnia quinoae]|uniref:DUF4132 domain-containing protein n=1 Tax=Fredinandcohnia quinoae TaxID=2918902 RepID=A0AAW5DWY7_9BACI|nr:DUF4132 domain-containing protein [Fredinandcohnia sp. SECRCQ15]MCH1624553.1 DUF4132 domain-containing protein [Fredinandcohnia sp. SECRCQ15]
MYYYEKSKKVKKYVEKIHLKSVLTIGRNKEILDAILSCHKRKGYSGKQDKVLYDTLWTENTDELSSIFGGSEFKVLVTLFGNEWARKFKKIWDNSPNYTYQRGYSRRSFRSKAYDVLYLNSAISKLHGMFHLVAEEFTYQRYFSEKSNYFSGNPVLPDLLALEIDENIEEVMSSIEDIVYGDNNTGLITREIIMGLLMSRNEKAHKWASDLLLAARLQEGLRQTIVECMDEGSKEGFMYMLKVILDHDLVRYSSIVRALDVWTGLDITAQKPNVIKKCLETAYRCLTENEYQTECLKSNDTMLIYMALWSIAFDDVALVEGKLLELMAAPEKYKRLVALYFLRQIQIPRLQHGFAIPLLDDPDLEVQGWALKNLFSDESYYSIRTEHRSGLTKYQGIEGACSSEELFEKLKNMLGKMTKKERVFTESVFPWCQIAITRDDILVKMMLTFADKPSAEKIDEMLDYINNMSADTRSVFLTGFLKNPSTIKQKLALIEFLGDKSSYVRSDALKFVKKLALTSEDYKIIEDLLRFKAGDLRKNAISILLKQPQEELLGSVQRLIQAKNENKQLAALDMLATIEGNPKNEKIIEECRQLAVSLSETSQTAKVLVEKITENDRAIFSKEEGFGLFDLNKQIPLPNIQVPTGFSSKQILSSSIQDIKKILQAYSNLVEEYREYEYETEGWDGRLEKVILGGEYNIRPQRRRTDREKAFTLEDYPLPEVWREAAAEHQLSTIKLLEILFYYNDDYMYRSKKDWYVKLVAGLLPIKDKEFKEFTKKLPYSNHIQTVFEALLNECPRTEVFQICRDMVRFIFNQIPVERFAVDYENRNKSTHYYNRHSSTLVNANAISFWYDNMRKFSSEVDEDFQDVFQIGYALYKASGFVAHTCIQLADFDRAYKLGLVDENELYTELSGRPLSPDNLRMLTDYDFYYHKTVTDCQKLKEVCKDVVDRIVTIELKRGDMATEVSHLASNIYRLSGTKFFVDILIGAGKDTYVRGYNFVGGDSTKKEIFSHLLKNCYPAEDEDEKTLKELIGKRKVTDKQLIEAAMYSPQWLDIVEKYLNWPGLKSTGWYFHAHINEAFSNDKQTIVARFSPISPDDFKDGAFDIDWFHESYSILGEKRFNVVYNSAKYIAGGGLHKRSQLFTDAMLGKLSQQEAEEIIKNKRNKDYVLCYGLIPLSKERMETLHRYEFLNNFLKESKQFGAQRRASEAKVVSISLDNLARNAGFSDTNRFTWSMETEKIHAIEQFLKPATVEAVSVHIQIDELGRAKIKVEKSGKQLKSIPSKLKNHEYVKEIKAVHKSLKEQYSRARYMLEKAMEAGDEFVTSELISLSEHPVIYPLLQNLVFKSGTHLGYFKDGALVDTEDQTLQLGPEDVCIIAHPVHLYKTGKWAAFQKDIFEREIIQPFKQVFRELYRPNADELASLTVSARYDGHQIQPRKAAALLKGRGWTVSYDEGLQKVYYKENIIAHIYAMADWYSPADVEAPTIEGVEFSSRETGKLVPFTDIPDIVFSEIMRDVDLVVSVAHVGGVDPEASLSTIEMRAAIMGELLRLLKITNVELKGSHALIDGKLGEYTVHLGSGVVHKMASGAVNILPIHSQHRGRIFLPFIDDDPKTAEITSKIVMLAEDHKIKDPTVLVQIANNVNV